MLGKEGPTLVLAMANEEELTRWMQALCEAVIEREVPTDIPMIPFQYSGNSVPHDQVSGPISPTHKNSFLSCAVLLTQNKVGRLHIISPQRSV